MYNRNNIICPVIFEKYTEEYLHKSLIWLQEPILKRLTNTPDFTEETQREWFESLDGRDDYYIRGIRYNGIPVGACGLKHINDHDAELWCYIGEESVRGKGIGHKIINHLIMYGKHLNLNSIWLYVIPLNVAAMRLYESHGFSEIKRDDKFIYMSLNLNKDI